MILKSIELQPDFFCEECRDGYLVSASMKEIWAVELDLWKVFDTICRENQLIYYANGGTAIGAARHKGFIPWDDDMDIMMPREHYNKLCSIASDVFGEPYFFQTEYTDPGTMRYHAQLRNSNTTAILDSEKEKHYTFNQGIFLDIFPMDNVPDDENERRRFRKRLLKIRKKLDFIAAYTSRYSTVKGNDLKAIIKRTLVLPITRLFYGKREKMLKLYTKYEELMQQYNCIETKMQGILMLQLDNERLIWEKSDFDSTVYFLYEGEQMPLPKGYDNILSKTYGNWKKYEIGNNVHGGVFFDVNKTYTEYI